MSRTFPMPLPIAISAALAFLIAISNGAPLPEASGISVITADNTRTIRQARMNVSTTTPKKTNDKEAYQVTFSGYFNVTATIYLDKNETKNINGNGKQWAISTAINFSALNGPLAVAFGNAGTHVTSSVDRNDKSNKAVVSGNAMGASVRMLDKTAVRMGGVFGTVKNGGSVTGTGGDESVRILAQNDRGTASATATAAGTEDTNGNNRNRKTNVEGSMRGTGGALAAVGTAGQVFQGDTYAAGSMHQTIRKAVNQKKADVTTHVMANGYGRSSEGGGGNAAVAGPGSSARSHHESNGSRQ